MAKEIIIFGTAEIPERFWGYREATEEQKLLNPERPVKTLTPTEEVRFNDRGGVLGDILDKFKGKEKIQ